MLEEPETCKSGVPTQDGSRSSSIKETSSSTSKMEELLMSHLIRIKKVKQSLSIRDTVVQTKDGTSVILMKSKRKRQMARLMKNSVSETILHSTSDQDYQ